MKTIFFFCLAYLLSFSSVYAQDDLVLNSTSEKIETKVPKTEFSVEETFQVSIIQNGGFHEIFWLTENSDDLSHFTIEIATIEGGFKYWKRVNVNHISKLSSYNVKLDESIDRQKYRMKVVFKDKSMVYSDVIEVAHSERQYYPLFLKSFHYLEVFQTDQSAGELQMELYSDNGELIQSFDMSKEYSLPIEELSHGAYTIKYKNDSTTGVWRFVKD